MLANYIETLEPTPTIYQLCNTAIISTIKFDPNHKARLFALELLSHLKFSNSGIFYLFIFIIFYFILYLFYINIYLLLIFK